MADLYQNLNPDFSQKLRQFQNVLKEKYGLETSLASGYRDNATQANLYAQGRTAPGSIVTNAPPGSSYHNYGAAADLKPTNMSEDQAAKVIKQAVNDGSASGLTWGGNFKSIYDPLHMQLDTPLSALQDQAKTASQVAANVPPQQGTQWPTTFGGGLTATPAAPQPPVGGAGGVPGPANPGQFPDTTLPQTWSPFDVKDLASLGSNGQAGTNPGTTSSNPLAALSGSGSNALVGQLIKSAMQSQQSQGLPFQTPPPLAPGMPRTHPLIAQLIGGLGGNGGGGGGFGGGFG